MQKVQEEAETTLGMLAFDAFPRFLKSKYSKAVMEDLKTGSNPNEVSAKYTTILQALRLDRVGRNTMQEKNIHPSVQASTKVLFTNTSPQRNNPDLLLRQ